MCGIFGIITNLKSSSTQRDFRCVTDELFQLSESRGKEASGIVCIKNNNIVAYKLPIRAKKLIKTEKYQSYFSQSGPKNYVHAAIGHSRLVTNGTQNKNENNQPYVGKYSAFIHNGIIVNDDVLWNKHKKIYRTSEVDTEIFVRLFELYVNKHHSITDALQLVFQEIIGETSIAGFLTHSPWLLLGTNTGSVYYLHTKTVFLFASEKYIVEEVIHTAPASFFSGVMPQIFHLSALQGLVFNTQTFSVIHINLKKNSRCKKVLYVPDSDSNITIDSDDSKKHFYISQDIFINSANRLMCHEPNYEKIYKIPRCSRCILPITMPLINFDGHGVCNFCRSYSVQHPSGKADLEKYVLPYRSNTNDHDCIFAFSGGRDSSYGLHYVKNILGLNPLAYTYDWGMVTDVARRNQSRMVSALGVEHVWVSADIEYKRKNIKKNVEAWLAHPDIAMVPLFMAGDKQAEYYIEKLKKKTRINLVIYCRGNQLEDERFKFGYYGIFDGTPKGVIHNLSFKGKVAMAAYFVKACIRNPRYINSSLLDTSLAYASSYLMSHKDFIYLWHYIPWNEHEIVSTLKKQYRWETPTDTIATWRIDDGTPPFYNYIYYHIQGFTEHDGLRSNQIREGVLSRKDALLLVAEENKPRFESLSWYFNQINIDGNKALNTIDAIPTLY